MPVSLKKIRFLIASGPTQEPLDPVRFLTNRSTGVMGRALAKAAQRRGHRVSWVECPTQARTALELQAQLKKLLPQSDVLIMAAAVCDVRPERVSAVKLKKEALSSIQLVKNPDILVSLSKKKKKGQLFMGFALESKKMIENGLAKLKEKGLGILLVQKVASGSDPFGERPVEAVLLDREGRVERLGLIGKDKVAWLLVRRAEKLFSKKSF